MFPADKLGKINTFAFPDTSDNGALISPTDFTKAASACNSSSNRKETFLSRKILPASITLSTHSCVADPLVEKLIKATDRKSTRLNSSHANISYAVFCLKKKKKKIQS